MSDKNPMICDNHLDIQMDADQIIKLVNEIESEMRQMLDPNHDYLCDFMQQRLNKIHFNAVHAKICAKDAMKQGQRMEKRLKRYFDSILKLGFERKGKI